jgi:hypothetical protein
MRCSLNTEMYEIDRITLDEIRVDHAEFNKKLALVENNLLKANKQFPLDYVQPPIIEHILEHNSVFKST